MDIKHTTPLHHSENRPFTHHNIGLKISFDLVLKTEEIVVHVSHFDLGPIVEFLFLQGLQTCHHLCIECATIMVPIPTNKPNELR